MLSHDRSLIKTSSLSREFERSRPGPGACDFARAPFPVATAHSYNIKSTSIVISIVLNGRTQTQFDFILSIVFWIDMRAAARG